MSGAGIETYAKKSFLALKNPYGSVTSVYPGIIDRVAEVRTQCGQAYYMGVKDTDMIPRTLVDRMAGKGFLKHTHDKMALGGRAVDLSLVNPLTGRWMTGSSSGTALNVFYGINDLGIGTDGGGSVLAPAAALNLFGFISPIIEEEQMRQHKRLSTDRFSFSPSIGFISREWSVLEKAIAAALPDVFKADAEEKQVKCLRAPVSVDIYGPRKNLIPFLKETVKEGVILISEEGPVDAEGMGDSIYGHFDERTRACQQLSGKGLMRVANMCQKSAVVIPGTGLAMTTLLICESRPEDIRAMLRMAQSYCCEKSEPVERYFMNFGMYL